MAAFKRKGKVAPCLLARVIASPGCWRGPKTLAFAFYMLLEHKRICSRQ